MGNWQNCHTVATGLDRDDFDAFGRLAGRLDVSVSKLLRYLIKYHLHQVDPPVKAGGLGTVTPLLEALTLDELKVTLEIFEQGGER